MANEANTTVRGQSASILGLAQNILGLTQDMTEYFQSTNRVAPTFDLDSQDVPDTPDYRRLHAALKTSLEDLLRLIDGPRRWLRAFCRTGYDLAALQIALDFDFFQLVPAVGSIALQDLADKAGLDLDRASRVVRQLITYRILEEVQPGVISHSSTSLVIHQDEGLRSMLHYSLDEMLKAAADCNTSLKENPYETNQNLNPFVTRHGVGIFEYYKNDPGRAHRFARAMAGLRKTDCHGDHLLDGDFNWSDIKGTVVDCGGGNGHISVRLAQLYPDLNFVVQDSNRHMLTQGRDSLPDHLRDRVTFLQHSFFDPQPVTDAAAFLIRQCTHNWSDGDVVTIFRSFVPGLESSRRNTPLLINDVIIPEPGVWPRHQERMVRQVDMVMMVNCGAKQRTKAEFELLLKEADPRYEIRNVFDNGLSGLLVVYLKRD